MRIPDQLLITIPGLGRGFLMNRGALIYERGILNLTNDIDG